ncbi:hypothetical protein SOVF_205130 [Spinacia oleracea]|nr:hypothetical protein SOVF_205130 [Spinacia oleracea]
MEVQRNIFKRLCVIISSTLDGLESSVSVEKFMQDFIDLLHSCSISKIAGCLNLVCSASFSLSMINMKF